MSGTDDALTEIFTSENPTSSNSSSSCTALADERLGGGAAELLVERRVEAAAVDADADRETPVLRLPGHGADVVGLADVPRVEPQAGHAGLHRRQRQLVLEVDVGDEGDGRAGHDPGQPLGRLLLVAGAADDVGAGARQGVDLGQGPVDVGRLRRRHRLDGDRRAAADGHGADVDLPCEATLVHRPPA